MDAAHHMRSPARHQSDRTGTIKKTRAARSSVWQPAGNRSPRSHGKADSTSRHTQRTGGFDRESDGYFPRDLARFGRASPITRPSPVISSTKSMCSSIGAILRRNASTCSSHCRRYADGVPNFRLPTFSTSAATAAGGTTAAIGSTIVRKDGTHDLP